MTAGRTAGGNINGFGNVIKGVDEDEDADDDDNLLPPPIPPVPEDDDEEELFVIPDSKLYDSWRIDIVGIFVSMFAVYILFV